MKYRSWRELAIALSLATPEEQIRIIYSMTPADLLRFDAEFEAWAHDSQLPPKAEGW